ncbi:MAG: hypothetical protein QW688_03070, partial [Thermoprotei archaeon]
HKQYVGNRARRSSTAGSILLRATQKRVSGFGFKASMRQSKMWPRIGLSGLPDNFRIATGMPKID